MGSPCALFFRGNNKKFNSALAIKLESEIKRLENRYSRFLPDSITTQINRLAGTGNVMKVDKETASLLDYAQTCYKQSEGLFDITSGSLRTLWNYQDLSDKQSLPDESDIQLALEKIGWGKVEFHHGSICLPVAGMEIDFGGIVKEYAADCVATLAEREGCVSGMVELGGDIRIFGVGIETEKMPPWQIGIRDPFNTGHPHALIDLHYGALATSGDYERYTLIRGKKYSHILNPITGWPVEGYSSVSVIADQCVLAGTAASLAVLKGENGEQWLRELGLPFLCIDPQGKATGTIQ
jgi:FAD:protein FMN transferase